MKKPGLIFLAVFMAAAVNAQNVSKPPVSELSQDQLNAELAKSLKTIKTGEIIVGTGIAVGLAGAICMIYGINESRDNTGFLGGLPSDQTIAGLGIVIVGVATTAAGIFKASSGQSRKKEIEMELLKFQPAGSATVYGIGLKISF